VVLGQSGQIVPISKIPRAKFTSRTSGRAPVLQVWSLEFELQSHQNKIIIIIIIIIIKAVIQEKYIMIFKMYCIWNSSLKFLLFCLILHMTNSQLIKSWFEGTKIKLTALVFNTSNCGFGMSQNLSSSLLRSLCALPKVEFIGLTSQC
jgi:hypothetical protein